MFIESSKYDDTIIIFFNFYEILGATIKSDTGVSVLEIYFSERMGYLF